jgi:hypothetical protein
MAEIDKVGKDALNTYEGFLGVSKIAIIVITLVLIAMAIFLV